MKDLFRPLLPSDIGVGTGQIVEFYNKENVSTQHDIILYDKSILPPIIFESKTGIFPIESVLYTIEVKTKLTADELRTSHEAAKRLLQFSYLPGQKDEHGREKHHQIEKVRSVIFAISSDLTGTGKNEAERYKEIYGEEYPYIRAICVAEKEYWYEKNGSWVKIDGTHKYDETLGFIGGVMNTYKNVATSRGRPNLGNYIIDTDPHKPLITVPSGTEPVVNAFCDLCGNKAVISFGNAEVSLNAKEGFSSTDRCKCGGTFRSPSGKYKILSGELIRVGDYEESENI